MKKFIYLILLVIAAGVIYYGSFYFRSTEVNEAAPDLMLEMRQQTGERGSNFMISSVEGEFQEVDAVHKGSGRAILIRQGDKRVLRLQDFRVTNGPDLYVYLSSGFNLSQDEQDLGEFINLGRLKGNTGNQNYEFSANDFPDTNLDEYQTAVIWCKQFGILFSYANMK